MKLTEANATDALPQWATNYPKVADLCSKDLGFRCAVINAVTEQYKNLLIRQAIKRSQ